MEVSLVVKTAGILRREWWWTEEKSAIVGLGPVPEWLNHSDGCVMESLVVSSGKRRSTTRCLLAEGRVEKESWLVPC